MTIAAKPAPTMRKTANIVMADPRWSRRKRCVAKPNICLRARIFMSFGIPVVACLEYHSFATIQPSWRMVTAALRLPLWNTPSTSVSAASAMGRLIVTVMSWLPPPKSIVATERS